MLALSRTYAARFNQFRPINDRVMHDVSCIRIRTPSWRHSLEALTYYVYVHKTDAWCVVRSGQNVGGNDRCRRYAHNTQHIFEISDRAFCLYA